MNTSAAPNSARDEFQRLAAFVQLHPNPVLEFAANGRLTYANDAAVAKASSLKKENPNALLPFNAAAIVKMCLSTAQARLHVRNTVAGRTFSWSFFPITAQQVVHCYAEDITDGLNLEAQLRQMQKMESVGQLAAGIAHDFNNVLTVIQGHAGLVLSEKGLDPLLADSARQISMAAERASNLTRQLLAFSRKQVLQPQLVALNEVLGNISKMLRSLLGANINLQCEPAPHLPPVYADIGMLEQVLINLAVNARDAMPKGGDLVISTRPRQIDDEYAQGHPEARTGFFVCLSVSDTGHGMDATTRARIFEPFFTTKELGKGTGLGLSTVYGIVKQHRGWMEVESQLEMGTTFNVFLPASSKASADTDPALRRKVPGGSETILSVEDEESLRELVEEILVKKGYTVLSAATSAQALALWREHRQEIDLLFTDMMMPEGLSGRDLAEQLRAEAPGLKVAYTSGYSPDSLQTGLIVKDGSNFLQKPYHPDMLAQFIRNALDCSPVDAV